MLSRSISATAARTAIISLPAAPALQVDAYSLDAQRDRILREAKHREMIVAAEFSDEGKSGKNTTGRPEFTEMLNQRSA